MLRLIILGGFVFVLGYAVSVLLGRLTGSSVAGAEGGGDLVTLRRGVDGVQVPALVADEVALSLGPGKSEILGPDMRIRHFLSQGAQCATHAGDADAATTVRVLSNGCR